MQRILSILGSISILIVLVGCTNGLCGKNTTIASVNNPPKSIWPMVGGDGARTFHGAPLLLNVVPKVVWKRNPLGNVMILGAVADEKRLVLVGIPFGAEDSPSKQKKYLVTALNIEDGRVLWKGEYAELGHVLASEIVLSKGSIFLASENGLTAIDCCTGQVVWHKKKNWGEPRPSNCLIADEQRLYVSLRSGEIMAFRCTDGQRIWKSTLDHRVSAIALRGKNLVAKMLTPPGVTALSIDTGHVLWRAELPSVSVLFGKKQHVYETGLPAISTNIVLIPASAGNPSMNPSGDHSYLAALNLNTGKLLWRATLPPVGAETVTADGRSAYVACDRYRGFLSNRHTICEVWCFDERSGRRSWKRKLPQLTTVDPLVGDPHLRSVVVSGQVILVAKSNGELFGLAAETGKILWHISLTGKRGIVEHVVVAGGHIIVVRGSEVIALKPQE